MPELIYDSPVGRLVVTETEGAITAITWIKGKAETAPPATPLLARAKAALDGYFSGKIKAFDLPLRPEVTPFQGRVLRVLSEIPYGKTRTYGEIAGWLGSAPRAVGGACGANPIPIFIPCHRVIAADGRLGGFSGGVGSDTKERLLALEGVRLDFAAAPSAPKT